MQQGLVDTIYSHNWRFHNFWTSEGVTKTELGWNGLIQSDWPVGIVEVALTWELTKIF
jgi:hypothetical protein